MTNPARSIVVTPEQEAAITQAVSRGERLRLVGHDGQAIGVVLANESIDELSEDEEAQLDARIAGALVENASADEWLALDDLRKLVE